MGINHFTEEIDFVPDNWTTIRKWISEVISDKKFSTGTINYIFCSDEYMLGINKQYLDHDTYTDIITFDYTTGKVISGDIFISIDRVKENAGLFKTTFEKELHRVIIHGILHLTGQKDKTDSQQKEMRAQEDRYLAILEVPGRE